MKLKFMIVEGAASLGLAAQSSYPQVTAEVAFAFEMNGRQMPAGNYALQYSAEGSYATIRHAETGRRFFFAFNNTSGVRLDQSVLTFLRHSDRYVLNAISDKANGNVINLPRGRAAKEMAKGEVTSVSATIAE